MTAAAWLKVAAVAWKWVTSRQVLGLLVVGLAIATLRATACRPAGVPVRASQHTVAPRVVFPAPPVRGTEDWPTEQVAPPRGRVPVLRPSDKDREALAEQIGRRDLVEPVPVVVDVPPTEPGEPPREEVVMLRRELVRTFGVPRLRWGASGTVTLAPAGDQYDVDLIAAARPKKEWLSRTRVGGAVGWDDEIKEFGDRWRAWVRHDLFRIGPVEVAVAAGWENRLTRSGWYVEALAEIVVVEARHDRPKQ